MKTLLYSLVMAGVLGFGSEASARVVVHVGPVHVGVGRVARPAVVHRRHVAARRVVRSAVRPVVVPAPQVVVPAPPAASVPAAEALHAARALRAERISNAIQQEVEERVEDALDEADASNQ
jgi:hypothetical protein